MPRVRVKVCGVTNPTDALHCAEAGADMLGLIFAESPRKVDAKAAYEIVRAIPPDKSSRASVEVEGPFAATLLSVHPVGVFKDQPIGEVQRILDQSGLSTVQLHGSEPPPFAQALKDAGKIVIKAMTPDTADPTYPADLFLLDIPKGEEREDESYKQAAVKLGRRLMLSGSLDPLNVGKWIRDYRPLGVDACRSTEISDGKKDPLKIKAFVGAVRDAQ